MPRRVKACKLDKRYSIRKEWTGKARPQWVARFVDKWVGSAPTKPGARRIACTFETKRMAPFGSPKGRQHRGAPRRRIRRRF